MFYVLMGWPMIYNRSFVNDHGFVVWMCKGILTCHGYDHDHQGGCPHKEAALALGLTLELADFCCEPPVGYTREQFLKAGFQISVWPLHTFHFITFSFSRQLLITAFHHH